MPTKKKTPNSSEKLEASASIANSVTGDTKPSQSFWPPIVSALVAGVFSVIVAYITTGQTFDKKLESLKTQVNDAQNKAQESAKQADAAKASFAALSEQMEALKKSSVVTREQLDQTLTRYALSNHSHTPTPLPTDVIRANDFVHLKFPNTNYYLGAKAGGTTEKGVGTADSIVNTAIPGYPPRTVARGDETFVIEKRKDKP